MTRSRPWTGLDRSGPIPNSPRKSVFGGEILDPTSICPILSTNLGKAQIERSALPSGVSVIGGGGRVVGRPGATAGHSEEDSRAVASRPANPSISHGPLHPKPGHVFAPGSQIRLDSRSRDERRSGRKHAEFSIGGPDPRPVSSRVSPCLSGVARDPSNKAGSSIANEAGKQPYRDHSFSWALRNQGYSSPGQSNFPNFSGSRSVGEESNHTRRGVASWPSHGVATDHDPSENMRRGSGLGIRGASSEINPVQAG
jgi:hypothetical protein